jgi:hypothetical protein
MHQLNSLNSVISLINQGTARSSGCNIPRTTQLSIARTAAAAENLSFGTINYHIAITQVGKCPLDGQWISLKYVSILSKLNMW